MTTDNNKKLVLILLGSFLAQVVQVGSFSLFLAQKLDLLGVQLSTIGWLVGIQWITVMIVAPIVPKIGGIMGLDNLNRLSGIISLGGLSLAFLNSEFWLAAASVLLGVGLIIRWVACDALVVQLSEPERVGRSIGIHEALMGFGIAIGPILFTVLSLDQVFLTLLAIVILSTAALALVRHAPHGIEDGQGEPMRKRDFLLIKIALLAATAGGFIETASVALFPFYFSADGFSLQQSALFISSFGFGGTLLQLPLGLLADRTGHHRVQLLACLVGLGGAAALLFSPASFFSIYVILFFFGGAVGAFNTAAVIQAGLEISIEKTASAMAYIAMFYTMGSIVGPVLTAYMLQNFSNDMVIYLYAMVIFFVAFVVMFELFVIRNRKKSEKI